MLIVLNDENKVLVMTKEYYPKGLYRIPTGGIEEKEDLQKGAERELEEETGITKKPKLIDKVEYTSEGKTIFTTYLFLVKSNQKPVSKDEKEKISGFKYLNKKELEEATKNLEKSRYGKKGWGKFRAIAHKLAAEKIWE